MSARRGAWARLGAVLVTGLALAASAQPASAHTNSANFSTSLTSVTPPIPGLSVTTTSDGAWLRVTNTSATPVIVMGYERDPYLKVSRDGVWQNTLSPATYLNRELTIGDVPPDVDPQAPPRWQRISAGPTAQFHDHRIHWMGNGRPPSVAQDPGHRQVIKTWTVPMLAGSVPVAATGTLSWVPNRFSLVPILLVGLGLAVAMTILVVLLRRQDRRFDRRLAAIEHGSPAAPLEVDA